MRGRENWWGGLVEEETSRRNGWEGYGGEWIGGHERRIDNRRPDGP